MKKIKAIIGVGAVLMAGACLLSSCNSETDTAASEVILNGDAIYPVQCEDTISVWRGLDSALEGRYENLGDTPMAQALEEQTGIKVEYVHPQAGQQNEQFNIMLASNSLPDVVMSNWAGYAGGADKAIEDEYILQLNDIIANYSPALASYLAENPEVDKKMKTDSGNYYAYPFVRGEDWMTCNQGLMIRKDWLDQLGMEVPQTLDEFEAVLRGFKTICTGAPLVLDTGQLKTILYAYGTMPDFYVEDGKVVYGYATEQFRDAVERIASWYAEGLIDNNLVSVDRAYIQARMLNGDAGACYGYVVSGMGALLDARPSEEFELVAIPQPTLDGGVPEFSAKEDSVLQSSATAISTNCKNPELAARWLDYGFTEAGHMLFNFGIEGESYTIEDGKPVFTDLLTNNPEGLSFSQVAVEYTLASGSGTFVQDPGFVTQSLTYREEQQNAYDVWANTNMSEHLMPPISFTSEEQGASAELLNDINTYAMETFIAFVTGSQSLDTFDTYLEQLNSYGLEEVLQIRQAAYDRYQAR